MIDLYGRMRRSLIGAFFPFFPFLTTSSKVSTRIYLGGNPLGNFPPMPLPLFFFFFFWPGPPSRPSWREFAGEYQEVCAELKKRAVSNLLLSFFLSFPPFLFPPLIFLVVGRRRSGGKIAARDRRGNSFLLSLPPPFFFSFFPFFFFLRLL